MLWLLSVYFFSDLQVGVIPKRRIRTRSALRGIEAHPCRWTVGLTSL